MIFTILGLINMILEKLSQSNIFLSLTLVQMKLENLFLTIKPTANPGQPGPLVPAPRYQCYMSN